MFAYGATGAGKTHTMLGSADNPGVMYRTMKELFKRMDDAKDEKEFAIAFSYLEVNVFLFILFSRLGQEISAFHFFFPCFIYSWRKIVFIASVNSNICCLQVYNEQIRDLLANVGPLAVREDSSKGVVIQGLTLHQVCKNMVYFQVEPEANLKLKLLSWG